MKDSTLSRRCDICSAKELDTSLARSVLHPGMKRVADRMAQIISITLRILVLIVIGKDSTSIVDPEGEANVEAAEDLCTSAMRGEAMPADALIETLPTCVDKGV